MKVGKIASKVSRFLDKTNPLTHMSSRQKTITAAVGLLIIATAETADFTVGKKQLQNFKNQAKDCFTPQVYARMNDSINKKAPLFLRNLNKALDWEIALNKAKKGGHSL